VNGFYKWSDATYFAFDGLSNSWLKRLDRSPGHAESEMEKTAAMRLGTFGHAYLLDAKEYDKLIKAPQFFPYVDKKGKQVTGELKNRKNIPWGDYASQYPDVDPKEGIILHHEQESFKAMKNNLLEYSIEPGLKFGDIYEKCKYEITVLSEKGPYSLQKKGKLDILYPDSDRPMIFDPKFTENSSELGKQISNMSYYRQDAFYTDLVFENINVYPRFFFIGIEKKAPYGVDFFEITEEYREEGRKRTNLSIEKYIRWVESGKKVYPSWQGINRVQKPKFLK
jgi:hypothetical protein